MKDLADLTQCILQLASNRPRIFVAIAGPPASGKTTLCEALAKSLQQHTTVAIVAMDGFHYDNQILKDNNLLKRKGAPNTFDVAGLQLLLNGLKNQTLPIAAPVFDRTLDLARNSARLINPEDKIILVEGNYLLCQHTPWNNLEQCFDYTVSLNVAEDELERRLIQRWIDHDHSPEQAKQRAHSNDLPNAKYVLENSRTANYELHN